ncbi:hypothetical protein SERLA73DRAFT_178033 [Serpula lacrymans var. lacrymans S7.3]|uniref:Autophagy-related protein 29 n=2 Tax=Serpula lacrymans var. lacrymans TaxID=341189 RepID=F8PQB0_SERL3|nr:uncharacterized protein SERLADRAFT_462202 [Serpula lacrymans var. lacrymans S7.9]EGO02211.1 hypothetical protein SERLA73DRAFT_178033 [Serpula lacrymans var. lacrymans S7.3]EGO27927.1 hypothetical protein SERLADRAFT_462202 [Serpula lacrymans var. lacrymans S7.9]
MSSSNIRVVVKLPYNRPEHPHREPPRIEWNAEKANVLWEVIALSRTSDNGGTDWKGLAAHLEVPLPYLLYRAQARYEEDLRGLQDIKGVLSPTSGQPITKVSEEPSAPEPLSIRIPQRRPSGSAARLSALSSSGRISTPLGVRARLNSLGHHTPAQPKKASSSSTLTLPKKIQSHLRPASESSSDETDSDDEQLAREEEADRKHEEQETLDRKLANLQKLITNDALGLVSSPESKGKSKEITRGRSISALPRPLHESFRQDEVNNRDHSASVSSASSPRESLPSISSPPPESQPHSPMSRHISSSKSSSPPALSSRNAKGQPHMRFGALVAQANASEQESSQGSSASSFSDISDASLSASALESALLSNIRGGGSRFSAIARSRFSGRGIRQ